MSAAVQPLPTAPALAAAHIHTLAQLFDARVAASGDGVACQWFDAESHAWRSESWQQLAARVQRLHRALAAQNLAPGARVAIMLPNSADWLAAEQAIYRCGLVAVGIYAQDTPGAAAHVLNDSGAVLAVVRDADTWAAVQASAPLPALRRTVLWQGEASGATGWQAFLNEGHPDASPADSTRHTLAALVYTSGTAGLAKGAMLTHGALLTNAFGCAAALPMGPDDLRLSLLPLSHSFERVAGWYASVCAGSATAFSRGPDYLADDLRALAPTVFLGVPRVFERLYARLSQAVDDGPLVKRALFHLVAEGGPHAPRFPQRLTRGVRQAVAAVLGGRLRFAVSGGAPLCPQLAGHWAALGVPVLQGYGLTEAGPVVSVNRPGDNDPDTVGLPLPGVETRTAPDGELLVRSPALMQGYWNDPAATQAVLDDAGWLHTGDKASRLSGERLVLTGRLKDLIVMSTGVKAAPAEIEARLTADPLVEQAIVLGEARPYLIALVVVEASALAALKPRSDDGHDGIEHALLARLRRCTAGLPLRFQPLRVAVVPPWTLANGLLTSTLKPRRAAIARLHAETIARLYTGHCSSGHTDCSRNAEMRE